MIAALVALLVRLRPPPSSAGTCSWRGASVSSRTEGVGPASHKPTGTVDAVATFAGGGGVPACPWGVPVGTSCVGVACERYRSPDESDWGSWHC